VNRYLQVRIDGATDTHCSACHGKIGWARMRCRIFDEPLESDRSAGVHLDARRCPVCIDADMRVDTLAAGSGLPKKLQAIFMIDDPLVQLDEMLNAIYPLVPCAVVQPLYNRIKLLELKSDA